MPLQTSDSVYFVIIYEGSQWC